MNFSCNRNKIILIREESKLVYIKSESLINNFNYSGVDVKNLTLFNNCIIYLIRLKGKMKYFNLKGGYPLTYLRTCFHKKSSEHYCSELFRI